MKSLEDFMNGSKDVVMRGHSVPKPPTVEAVWQFQLNDDAGGLWRYAPKDDITAKEAAIIFGAVIVILQMPCIGIVDFFKKQNLLRHFELVSLPAGPAKLSNDTLR